MFALFSPRPQFGPTPMTQDPAGLRFRDERSLGAEMVKNLLESEDGSAKMMRRRLDETGVWRERT
jgi:hypothetical protein